MRRLLPPIALLLVFVMTPMAAEMAENVVHLLTQGHAAHALNDDAHRRQGPEHGCSGPFHVCACHASIAFTAQSVSVEVAAPDVCEACVAWCYRRVACEGHLTSLFRPPIV